MCSFNYRVASQFSPTSPGVQFLVWSSSKVVLLCIAQGQTGIEMEAGELGKLVDEYGALRDERIAADKVARNLKTRESQLKALIIAECNEADTHVVGGSAFSVKHTTKSKPVGKDWSQVYEWILSSGDVSVLHKRLTEDHIKQLTEDGTVIPGIDWYEVDDLSLSVVKVTKN